MRPVHVIKAIQRTPLRRCRDSCRHVVWERGKELRVLRSRSTRHASRSASECKMPDRSTARISRHARSPDAGYWRNCVGRAGHREARAAVAIKAVFLCRTSRRLESPQRQARQDNQVRGMRVAEFEDAAVRRLCRRRADTDCRAIMAERTVFDRLDLNVHGAERGPAYVSNYAAVPLDLQSDLTNPPFLLLAGQARDKISLRQIDKRNGRTSRPQTCQGEHGASCRSPEQL